MCEKQMLLEDSGHAEGGGEQPCRGMNRVGFDLGLKFQPEQHYQLKWEQAGEAKGVVADGPCGGSSQLHQLCETVALPVADVSDPGLIGFTNFTMDLNLYSRLWHSNLQFVLK